MATATISLYRVTGWEPTTGHEYNLGIYIASDRDAAIRKAQRNNANVSGLVLDAATFGEPITEGKLARIANRKTVR